ncbi:hypothetical protein [Streptosporangium sp. NPDC002524]|uniref:hypothetical protein n=1 Tax=Streptosporangium sp. NPDC002524 TaxID=3154537 RepID=UPI00332E09D8
MGTGRRANRERGFPGRHPWGRQTRYVVLAVAVGAVAVGVPPLLTPGQDGPFTARPRNVPSGALTPPAPSEGGRTSGETADRPTAGSTAASTAGSTAASTTGPAVTSPATPPVTSPATPAVSPGASRGSRPAVRPEASPTARSVPRSSGSSGLSCVAPAGSGTDGTVEITSARPSCAVYTTVLSTGWQALGTGTNVTPGQKLPGGEQTAMRVQKRVERREDPATVTLLASSPFTVGRNTTLRLRVFGGREFGTILRVSASPSADRAGTRTMVLQAPPLRWSSFTLRVGALSPGRLRRVDLAIATDQMPQAYEFFVDDIVFRG